MKKGRAGPPRTGTTRERAKLAAGNGAVVALLLLVVCSHAQPLTPGGLPGATPAVMGSASTVAVRTGQELADAVAAWGQAGGDVILQLLEPFVSVRNATFTPPVSVANQPAPFSRGTLLLQGGFNSSRTVLDAGMRHSLIPQLSGTARVHLCDVTIVNMCESLDRNQGPSAVHVELFQRAPEYQSHTQERVVLYARQADVAQQLYLVTAQETRFSKVRNLTSFLHEQLTFGHTVFNAVTPYMISIKFLSYPSVLAKDIVYQSLSDPDDPLLRQLTSQGLLMAPQYCQNGTVMDPGYAAQSVDPTTGPIWVSNTTHTFMDYMSDAALQTDRLIESLGLPPLVYVGANISLAGTGTASGPERELEVCSTLILAGPYSDDYAGNVTATLDLADTAGLMQLTHDAQLFIQNLRVLGLVRQELPALPGAPSEPVQLAVKSSLAIGLVIPPPPGADGYALWTEYPRVGLHNVTLLLHKDDYAGLAQLLLRSTSDKQLYCAECTVDPSATADMLAPGVAKAVVQEVGPSCEYVLLSQYTGWGVNATLLRLQPDAQPGELTLHCDHSVPSSSDKLTGTQVLGLVLGLVLGCGAVLALMLVLWWRTLARSHSAPPESTASGPRSTRSSLSGVTKGALPVVAYNGQLASAKGVVVHSGSCRHSASYVGSSSANSTTCSSTGSGREVELAVVGADGRPYGPPSAHKQRRAGTLAGSCACTCHAASGSAADNGDGAPGSLLFQGVQQAQQQVLDFMQAQGLTLQANEPEDAARDDLAFNAFASAISPGSPSIDALSPAMVTAQGSVDASAPGGNGKASFQDVMSQLEPLAAAQHAQRGSTPGSAAAVSGPRSGVSQPSSEWSGAASPLPVGGGSGDVGEVPGLDAVLLSVGAPMHGGKAPGSALKMHPALRVKKLAAELNQTANKVVLVGLLGQGSWGTVYKGVWRGLPVALKTMVFDGAELVAEGEHKQQPKAIMEAAIAASVGHRNVVATYHYDIKPVHVHSNSNSNGGLQIDVATSAPGLTSAHDDMRAYKLFLVQELCGLALSGAIQNRMLHKPDGTPEQADAFHLLLDIARGIEYLHGKGIIHGDLKPANVLLSVDGQSPVGVVAKLADFGLSTCIEAGATHVSNYNSGTPFYVAPEVVNHFRALPASDIYSFGVLMWQVFTGHTPFITNATGGFSWSPAFPHFGHPALPCAPYIDLCYRCLQREPHSRPNASELVSTLQVLCVQALGQQAGRWPAGAAPLVPAAAVPAHQVPVPLWGPVAHGPEGVDAMGSQT